MSITSLWALTKCHTYKLVVFYVEELDRYSMLNLKKN